MCGGEVVMVVEVVELKENQRTSTIDAVDDRFKLRSNAQ